MTPRVEVFSGTEAEWDACVHSAPAWTHFQQWRWKPVIEGVFGHDCVYLAARDRTGQVTGVLPLVHARSLVFGDYLISMPFLNYGGPLGDDASVNALVEEASEIARARKVDLLELRSRESLPIDASVSNRKITCVLDLTPGDPDSVWRDLDSNVRRKVRHAQKQEFGISFGPDQVDSFYAVFSRHMRDLGTPTLPRRWFQTLAEQFGDSVWIGCVYSGSRPVAGAFGFQWNGELEVTWVSALRDYHRHYANMLLYWAFIERATAQSLRLFNFGRCTPGSGTHRFKQQWGARDVPLMWYQPLTGARRAKTPSPNEGAFSWGPRVWKRLPLALTNALGPAIVRMIP